MTAAQTARMTPVREQAQEVGVAEDGDVVVQREALKLAQILAVVERAYEEDYHRQIEEDVHERGPDFAEALHIVATPSSSSVKRFMSQMLTKTSSMSTRLIAAPKLRLSEPLNWSSMTSPIMVLLVPPSFWEM